MDPPVPPESRSTEELWFGRVKGGGNDATGPASVEVCVLGPCVAIVDGATTHLAATLRRVLARLALSAPEAVSTDALARAVWDVNVPSTARAALANHVARLRRALGADGIRTVPGGYRLAVATDVDAVQRLSNRAERARSDGDPDAAFALAEEALGRWRGEPFEELIDLDEAGPAREGIARHRGVLEGRRLAAALALGRSGWAVAEGERLIAEDDRDEERWVLLVRALAADARRADALDAVDRSRRALRRSAGASHTTLLSEVELEVLGSDPGAAPRFLGRQPELDRLVAAAGASETALVRGETGSGRSSLLNALVRRLRQAPAASGLRVASTRSLVNPATALAVLDDLLEDLGEVADRRLGPIQGFAAAVNRVAARRPVVLVVDDLHLVGLTSQAALTAAADLDGVALFGSLDADPSGAEVHAGATVLDLAPLDDGTVRDLAVALLDEKRDVTGDELQWLVEMSGGNPLVLECLLDREADGLILTGTVTQAALAPMPVTAKLRDLTRRRLDRLDAAARTAVEVIAVCGDRARTTDITALAPALGILAAQRDGILDAAGDVFRFRHGAIGRAVYADIPGGRRVELHHALASSLENSGAPAARVAPHHLAAAELDPHAAVTSARLAGVEATQAGAHADAARWFEQALPAARALKPEGGRVLVEVLIGQGDALRLAGNARHEEVLFEAADLAIDLGQVDLVGDAAIAQLELGATTGIGHLHERAVALADYAMELITDPDQRAQVAAAASLAHSMSGHPDRCRALFVEAEAEARSDVARRAVLPHADGALAHPDDLDRREVLAKELIERGVRAEDPAAHFEGLMLDHGVALQRADGARLRTDLEGMAALADIVGDVGRRWCVLICSVGLALLEDQLDDAERTASEALALFTPVSPSRAFATHVSHLMAIRLAQGRITELGPTTRQGVVDQPAVPLWHSCVALTTAPDDPATARHHAEQALDTLPRDLLWLPGHLLGGRAAAVLGDRNLIDRYAERLRPYADLVSWQGSITYGPVATVLGALALASGDRTGAAEHSTQARRLATSLEAPLLLREIDDLMAGR